MNFLKSFWCWLMADARPKHFTKVIVDRDALRFANVATEKELGKVREAVKRMMTQAYDPSEDEERTLRGENESYFD